jgi:hypothetical protein
MKNEYFNEREKRLFNFFSKKDDYYKGCYLGETNPIIDNKINKIEKEFVKSLKAKLKKIKDKNKRGQLLELINLYEPKVEVKKVEETVVPAIIEESVVKKPKEKTKELFVFKAVEPYRKDYSRLVYWCNPFEPINKGKLGTTQGWRKEEKFPQYY